MNYRLFGKTGLNISEISFGSWSISGDAYGDVSIKDAHRAMSVAGDHGCNFIDTASVYGNAESYIGSFFKNSRDKWYISTKYSGQKDGFEATLNRQLQTLNTDYIDFYQLHWVPKVKERSLYDQLVQAKKDGKVRFIGMSVYSDKDIDNIIKYYPIDGVQLPFSLLQPYPYLTNHEKLKKHNIGILVRSSLYAGYLTGKYKENNPITAQNDIRSKKDLTEHNDTIRKVNLFKTLESKEKSLIEIAVSYPLTYDNTSSVLLGTRSAEQAEYNFGKLSKLSLTNKEIEAIYQIQKKQGLHPKLYKKMLKRIYKKLSIIYGR
jgi:aryl-alcohol dehydrogenase-like predicted oxidoreductase